MNERKGYLVASHNGQGKYHFFETYEEAKKFHDKKHKDWSLVYAIERIEDGGLTIYTTIRLLNTCY